MIWATVLVGSFAAFALKLAGFVIPERLLSSPTMRKITLFIPVSLLAGLLVVQTFASGTALTIDARVVGLAAAAISLALRAPLLVAVIAAAASAALVRYLGWLP
jgi:branched-subunit amino acid transport protein AzlD